LLKKSELPFTIEVKQSHYLLAFIIISHGLALLSSFLIAVQLWIKIIVLCLIAGSLLFYLHSYRQKRYCYTFKHTAEFGWELAGHSGFSAIRILNSSVITLFVIILHVEYDTKKISLLICKDAVIAEIYRRLLVALKINLTD